MIKTLDMKSLLWRFWLGFWRWRQETKYLIVRFLLWFNPFYCNWHKGDWPMTYDPEPENKLALASCPECGCLLNTRVCARCGQAFLDFEAQGFDDVMGAPTVTESGDLMCVRCARYCQEDEEAEYKSYDDYDDYDEERSQF